ncbi:MAG: metal-sulfur cluster assembly factor [Actinomycetia bacterium]|nr:metal-sulfur cluster assembly factor [Actinomycetes bacterium]
MSSRPTPESLREALAEISDPEYPISIVDLGLVRGVTVHESTATVQIAFCSLGCPCIELIVEDIEQRLLEVPGIDRVEVEEVFERWTRSDISPDGLKGLRQIGVA